MSERVSHAKSVEETALRLGFGDELSQALCADPDGQLLFDAIKPYVVPDIYPSQAAWVDTYPIDYRDDQLTRVQDVLTDAVSSKRFSHEQAQICAGWLGIVLAERPEEQPEEVPSPVVLAGQLALFGF